MTATLADMAPMLDEAERQVLIARISDAQASLVDGETRATGNAVYRAWLGGGVDLDADEWARSYAAIVSASQRNLHAAQIGYLAEYASLAEGAVVGLPEGVIAIADDAAWLIGSTSQSATAGHQRLGRKIIEGTFYRQAVEETGRYLSLLSGGDLQTAIRQAGNDWNAGSSYRFTRWRKVTSGASCGWCRMVADRGYREADTVARHQGDRCGVAPIVRGDGYRPRQLQPGSVDPNDPAPPEAATLPPSPTEGAETA